MKGKLSMSRLKSFLKYILWGVLFFVFSNFLISVGLNSTYKPLERKDNISEITIYQSEATSINGRIRGLITNSDTNNLSEKYLEFDFYSSRNILLGKKFIQVNQLKNNDTQNIELFFKLNGVKYYNISVLDTKPAEEEIELLPKDLTKPEIILGTALAFFILW